jgi:hypothetical protein
MTTRRRFISTIGLTLASHFANPVFACERRRRRYSTNRLPYSTLPAGNSQVRWSGWKPVPGGRQTNLGPTLLYADSTLWLAVRGAGGDDQVYITTWPHLPSGQWEGTWTKLQLPHGTPSSPMLGGYVNDDVWLALRGNDDRPYAFYHRKDGWHPAPAIEKPNGRPVVSSICIASDRTFRKFLIAPDDNGNIWWCAINIPEKEPWTRWWKIEGKTTLDSLCATHQIASYFIDLFMRDTSGLIYNRVGNTTWVGIQGNDIPWGDWLQKPEGVRPASAPYATFTSYKGFYGHTIAYRNAQGAVMVQSQNGGAPWGQPEELPGIVTDSSPAIATRLNVVYVVAKSQSDQQIYFNVRS